MQIGNRRRGPRAAKARRSASWARVKWLLPLVLLPLIVAPVLLRRGRHRTPPPGPSTVDEDAVAPRFLEALVFSSWPVDKEWQRLSVEWLAYVHVAGVQHVLWYSASDALQPGIDPFVKSGFVQLFSSPRLFPDIEPSQQLEQHKASHKHGVSLAQERGTHWLMLLDPNEYPFREADTKPGFLPRFLRRHEKFNPNAAQILLQCQHFVLAPESTGANGSLLIQRATLRKPATEGDDLDTPVDQTRVKPILKPDHCTGTSGRWSPHRLSMHTGATALLPTDHLRMNAYQSPLKAVHLPNAVEDKSILPLAANVRRVLTPVDP